jgi:hypothetical protein
MLVPLLIVYFGLSVLLSLYAVDLYRRITRR